MRHFHTGTVLDFGKNKGMTAAEVFRFQPSYIEWMVMKTPDMVVDLDALEALPPPQTIGYNPQHFSEDKPKLEFNEENVFAILRTSDTVNHFLKAYDIK